MKFKCAFNHEWEANAGNIIGRNSWCPTCSSSLYERICRLYFETLFDKKFPTSYPEWLRNKNGEKLELDGYCEELKLAFEHHGLQHYSQVKFRGSLYEFEKLRENDAEKEKLCKENGVRLIVIPELVSMTKIEDLKQFIKDKCIELSVELPENYDDIEVNYLKVYQSNKDLDKLEEFKNKLLAKNIELLSTVYLGSSARYDVKCLIYRMNI